MLRPEQIIDICIVTFQRLPYIQKCLSSLIANTNLNEVRIHVIDDGSKDGTVKFLNKLKDKGLIDTVIADGVKRGTAENFNYLIKNCTKSEWFFIANDDMWFKENWLKAVRAGMAMPNSGTCTIFDYTRYNIDHGVDLHMKLPEFEIWTVPRTGLGASGIWRDAFVRAGGFKLKKGQNMGFFATKFCGALTLYCPQKGKHYAIRNPVFALHMDLPRSKLCEREHTDKNGYNKMRSMQKYNRPGMPNG